MQRAIILSIAAALALPALAADEPKGKSAEPASTAVVLPAEPAADDSPLVTAARSANRLGRKPSNLITNETLKTAGDGAHVTTTQNQPKIAKPPAQPPSLSDEARLKKERDDQKKRDREDAARKRAQQERQQRLAAAAAHAEDDLYDSEDADPAQAEKRAAEAAARAQQKPPTGN